MLQYYELPGILPIGTSEESTRGNNNIDVLVYIVKRNVKLLR